MLVNNISNKNVIQKLKVNSLESPVITNNILNSTSINTTNINTTNLECETINVMDLTGNILYGGKLICDNTFAYPYPITIQDRGNFIFKVSSSGGIYGSNLYINNSVIDFSSYATMSYVISNYPSLTYLNGYRTIADSWSRSDTSNEVEIRTGYTDGTTCKSHDDSLKTDIDLVSTNLDILDGDVGVLDATVAGLVTSVGVTEGQIGVLEGQVAVLEGQTASLEADVATLNTTVGEHTANLESLDTKTLYQSTGTNASGNYTMFSGSISCSDIEPIVSVLNIATSALSLNSINIGSIGSTITIGGVLYSPFNQMSGFIQW